MFAKIKAIIGAINAVASIIKTIESMYNKYMDKKIDTHYDNKEKRRERLLSEIAKEKDDDKLRDLHRRLRTLDSSK